LKTIYFVLGQTATGKTARAAKLARETNGELINCDSRQVYKHLNIITGKTDNPLDIPMHMVDLVDPSVRYSAHEYAVETKKVIDEMVGRGKTPIIIGGTGLYAYYLLHLNPDHKTSALLDQKESMRIDALDIYELEQEITQHDPRALEKLNPSDRANPHRLGSLLKKILDPDYVSPLFPTVTLADTSTIKATVLLHDNPEEMRARISNRVTSRIKNGAIEECQQLLNQGYTSEMPGLQTLGYAQIFSHLRGECTIEEAEGIWIDKEYQYARRQKLYLSKYISEATFERV